MYCIGLLRSVGGGLKEEKQQVTVRTRSQDKSQKIMNGKLPTKNSFEYALFEIQKTTVNGYK